MASSPASRPLRYPSADFANHPLPRTRQAARKWCRVHPAIYKGSHFSLLPTHRFSHPGCPHKLLYMAMEPAACLWECFGDRVFDNGHALPKTVWDDSVISLIELPELYLCDLGAARTRSALAVDLTALMHDDLSVPQAWGLAIQRHPSQVQGIKFRSRFSGTACLALFERGPIPAQLAETPLGPLNRFDPALNWLKRFKIALT